jgi:F420-non-reducing hydrogenase small subunit
MKKKVSTEWLSVCGGCHVSIVDLHEKIMQLFDAIELYRCPVLTDIKDYPKVDIGIISGAIRTEHDIIAANKMRNSCQHILAFGTCAVFGGISGAGCVHSNDEIFDVVYRNNKTTNTNFIPSEIPKLIKNVVPLDQIIEVDSYLPGCPPHPVFIFSTLNALIKNTPQREKFRNICAKCKRSMFKNKEVNKIKSKLDGIPDPNTCFLSQGYLCFGAVTLDRCMSPCTNKGVACTGCCGPSINVLQEPTVDVRTKISELMSDLTNIDKHEILSEIETFAKTHYAYSMASDMVNKKQTFQIWRWMEEGKKNYEQNNSNIVRYK